MKASKGAMTRGSLVLGAVLVLVVVLLLSRTTSGDLTLTACGTINESAVIANDITASGDCFTVTGNDLTIDCRLHTVAGDGTGIGLRFSNNAGVMLKNCIIENFATGIDATDSSLQLETNKVNLNGKGIATHGETDLLTYLNAIQGNTVFNAENTNPGRGIEMVSNWWGTTNPAQIAATLSGNITYQPFLTQDPYADPDADLFFDFMDNCPAVSNPDQADEEADSVGNACDNCPDNRNPFQENLDNDTAGDMCDLDDDADGFCDYGPTVFQPIPGNLALNKNITASSFVFPHVPSLAVDGNFQTFLAMVGDPPQHVTLDLGTVLLVNHAAIHFNDSSSILWDYALELSTDGTNFRAVAGVIDNLDIVNHLSFAPESARYLKIRFIDYDYEKDDVRINEFQVSGTTASCIGGRLGRDTCPMIADPGQEDSDNDSIGNSCDNCVAVLNPDQFDSDADGKGDACDLNLFFPAVVYDPLSETGPIFQSPFASNLTTGFFIVQFSSNSLANPGWENTTNLSLNPIRQYANFGWLVQTNASLTQLQAIPGVRAVTPFQPLHKISKELFESYQQGQLAGSDPILLSVQGTSTAVLSQQVSALGGTFINDNPPLPPGFSATDLFYTVTIARNRVLNISFIPEIISVQEKVLNTITTDLSETTIGVASTGWVTYGLSGTGQSVGIHDDGFDTNHTDFGARIMNVIWPGGGPTQASGHGTHTSGTVAGSGVKSVAVGVPAPGFRGPAYNANIYLSEFNTNLLNSLTTLAAAQNGLVHSNSWADGAPSCTGPVAGGVCSTGAVNLLGYGANAQTFDNFVYATQRNFTPVVAAANYGQNNQNGGAFVRWNAAGTPVTGTVSSVATAKNIITVGASDNMRAVGGGANLNDRNSNEDVSGYSSRGPTNFNRQIKPDVVAPGSWIVAARASQVAADWAGMGRRVSQDYAVFGGVDNYSYSSGTSMATPHVAGFSVLIREWLALQGTSNTDNNLVKALVINGAQDMLGSSCAAGGGFSHVAGSRNHACLNIPNVHEGWGRVNMTRSIDPCQGIKCLAYQSGTVPQAGPEVKIPVRLSSDRPVEATLTWLEPSTAGTTLNQLYLNLSLGLDYYLSNHFGYPASTGQTIKGGVMDPLLSRENVHKIIITTMNNFEDGFYTLALHPVIGSVTDPAVRYSVAISGLLGVDSANVSNVTHFFPAGNKIYVDAIGLKNNTNVEVVVVANRPDYSWNTTVAVTDGTGLGVNGFRFITKKALTTNTSGQFNIPTEVWDTAGSEHLAFASNGSFNMFVKYGAGHPITFVNGTDVIDYHNKLGFRVAVANSSIADGNFSDNITYGEAVYIKGVGFAEGSNVSVLVIKNKNSWTDGETIPDIVARRDGIVVTSSGLLDNMVWNAPAKADVGKYDLVVDANQDGKYQASMDVIDGKDTVGFTVICKSDEVCGSADSAKGGVKENNFVKGESVSALGNVFRGADVTWAQSPMKAYKVLSASPVEDLEGTPLIDVTGNPTDINVPVGQLTDINTEIWHDAQVDNDYELILDTDGDAIFNASRDIYDPDGFVVTREIKTPRIAVDSKGNLHVVALEREVVGGLTKTNTIYAKVEAQSVKIDLENPELFDWSTAEGVNFRTVREDYGAGVNFPDIAVDGNDEPYIVFGRQTSGFEWLIIIKLNKDGNRDRCWDRSDQSVPAAADLSNCDGNGLELLYYHWDDFEDARLNFPTISVDNSTNQPVISANVFFTFPDSFYYTHIYPLCFIGQTPIIIHPLVPIFYFPTIQAGVVTFRGDSIQVARRVPGSSGTIQWPHGAGTFPEAFELFMNAANEVDACLGDIATTSPRGDENWQWITVDQRIRAYGGFDLSRQDVDLDGNIHMVYRRQQDFSSAGSPTVLKHSKVTGNTPGLISDVSTNTPSFWFPSIDVDPDGRSHIAWQSGQGIFYNTIDSSGNAGVQQQIASLNNPSISSRPSVASGAGGDPHVVWTDINSVGKGVMQYREGENVGGSVSFPDPAVTLADTANLSAGARLVYPLVDTNKLGAGSDWTDKVYAAWLQMADKTTIKFRRTTPHVTVLLVLDGVDKEFLQNNLGSMTNLQQLMNEYPTLDAGATPPFPATTMSTQAAMFTGLKPKNSEIPGDNFKGGSDFTFVPDNNPSVDDINSHLSSNGVQTVFDYLELAERSKAGIPAIYRKGIGSARPDHYSTAVVDFTAGTVDESGRTSYLSDLKNNDQNTGNDVADLLVAYLLSHDHGINDNPTTAGLGLAQLDAKIGDIMDKLEEHRILNDTVFIITADHGMADTVKDDNHSLSNADLPSLQNPLGVTLSTLFYNGRVAYSDDGLDAGKVYHNNSFGNLQSVWFGALDRVIVKDAGVYKDVVFNAQSQTYSLSESGDGWLEDMTYSGSPNLILVSADGYYFGEEHEASYGEQTALPFIITGPGFGLLSAGGGSLPATISSMDIAPTLAFFAGGQKAVDLMTGIDGENFYDPELVIVGGSPVNFHLYDSQGRHLGPDLFGNIESQIPGASYEIDDEKDTGHIKITVLKAADDFRLEVDSTGYGKFGLSIRKRTGDGFVQMEYPRTSISPDSFGKLNLSTFDLQLDYNGDGNFETVVAAPKTILIEEDLNNSRAKARLVSVPAKDPNTLDMAKSTGTLVEFKNRLAITNGLVEVQKYQDESLTQPGFYTFGSFVEVNFSQDVIDNAKYVRLKVQYPDYLLIPNNLSERSLAVYDKATLQRLPSTVDLVRNTVTAAVNLSGQYLLATTDQVPRIDDILVSPDATNQLSAVVQAGAIINDDSMVTNATVTLGNQTMMMAYNSISGRYEATLTGPAVSGEYPVVITAADDTENTASRQSKFILDLDAPRLTILSPENTSYLTNRITFSFYANEPANVSYTIDGGILIPLNSTRGFRVITIPLILSGGNHTLEVTAVDRFSNLASRALSFEVEHQSIVLSGLSAPLYARPGDQVTAVANVENTLIAAESGVLVQLLINGNVTQSQLLDIPGESSVQAMFTFTLPEGRYDMRLNAVPLPQERVLGDNSQSQDLLITSKVPVLLVQDDAAANSSVYAGLIQAAGGLGYDYITFDTLQKGPPATSLLDSFPLVLWLAGQGGLSPIEMNRLKAYLDNRGNLLVFSKRLSAIASTDFYQGYLDAEFRRQAQSKTIEGTFRDAIGRGLLFSITDFGEEVRPRAPATESLRYSGGDAAAIKTDHGVFKSVYYTFGMEDVNDTTLRQTLMDRTLSWFDIDIVAPILSDLVPAPDTAFPVNTSNVTLSLSTDETAECRLSQATAEFGFMQPFDLTNSVSHSTLLTGLENGRNYTYLIRCRDVLGNEAGTITSFFIHNRTFQAPVLQEIPYQETFENQLHAIPISVTDPEADPVTITVRDVETVGVVPIASRFSVTNTSISLQTGFNDAGSYRLRVEASDGFASASQEFFLTIINVNRPPVLAAIGNRNILEDVYFLLDVQASDPDNENLAFSDNTGLFDINPSTGVISFTPKNEHVGVHVVNITVTDGNLSDSEAFQLTVTNTNDPPVFGFIPSHFSQEGILFTLQLNATDPDNNTISWSDDTVLFNITPSGFISFTPGNEDVGTHFINITASDGIAAAARLLNLVVYETNAAPVITGIPGVINTIVGGVFELNVSACDPDTDPGCAAGGKQLPNKAANGG